MPPEETGYFIVGESRLPYAIERSKRRRRTIGLMIGKGGNLRILAPWRTAFGAIETLVHRQQHWINRRLADYRAQQAVTAENFVNGQNILFQGARHSLRLMQDRTQAQGCMLDNELFTVNLHDPASSNDARREEVRLEILLWYKKQARQIFEMRAQFWSEKLGLRYRRFSISNPKRLWGSCSGRDDVRINWRLIMAPSELLDYVIVHELCHIRHKNHSARFWNLVATALPDCMERRKRLRQMTAMLDW